MSSPLTPENTHLSLLRDLLAQHNREYVDSGVHFAYSDLIRLIVTSSVSYNEDQRAKVSKVAPAEYAELPLLARIATNPKDGPGKFRVTLGRVNPSTLEDLPGSRLNIAVLQGRREFSDIAETFTNDQVLQVALHASQIINIDGLIGRE